MSVCTACRAAAPAFHRTAAPHGARGAFGACSAAERGGSAGGRRRGLGSALGLAPPLAPLGRSAGWAAAAGPRAAAAGPRAAAPALLGETPTAAAGRGAARAGSAVAARAVLRSARGRRRPSPLTAAGSARPERLRQAGGYRGCGGARALQAAEEGAVGED